MTKRKNLKIHNRTGTSYAISAVIISATTIVLVLIASSFAYQLLEQQKGMSELDVVTQSMSTFDDVVRDVAWSFKGSRYTRFAMDYGHLSLHPDNTEYGLPFTVNVSDYGITYSGYTGFVEYSIPTQFVTYSNNYELYLSGDEQLLLTQGTSSLGQILLKQDSNFVNVALKYRVRVMESSVSQVGSDTVSYVNIWIIKMKIHNYENLIGELDLVAKSYNLTTITFPSVGNGYDSTGSCDVNFTLGDSSQQETLSLNGNKVVFNLIISEVEILA